uniref:Uncharacterized protein MANES_01G266800 n=1 Tax=Rhizophora mucronata TaxID=61149 RepID=A0A2P2J2Q8_RHIMU
MAQICNGSQRVYYSFSNLSNHNELEHRSSSSSSSVSFRSKLRGSSTCWGLRHFQQLGNYSAIMATTPLRVSASVATAEKPSTAPEIVLQPIKEISGTVKLPGSKSLSNRVLLLAALSEGRTIVDNLLSSDDIHYMLGALKTLGLHVEHNSELNQAIVEGCGGQFPAGIESKNVELFLGNAGTAMRPLTAAVTVAGGNSRL